MSNDLNQITKRLGNAHKQKTVAEKELKESRNLFFDAIYDEILDTETLAQQTIEIPNYVDDVVDYIKQFYPGWYLIEHFAKEDKTALIEEDPSFKKFVYVNQEDENLYKRNVSQAGPSLDDERLKEEDPKLWKRITDQKTTRVLKDLETVSNDDLAAMQKYFVPGPMTVKLDAPRKAKPEELT